MNVGIGKDQLVGSSQSHIFDMASFRKVSALIINKLSGKPYLIDSFKDGEKQNQTYGPYITQNNQFVLEGTTHSCRLTANGVNQVSWTISIGPEGWAKNVTVVIHDRYVEFQYYYPENLQLRFDFRLTLTQQ